MAARKKSPRKATKKSSAKVAKVAKATKVTKITKGAKGAKPRKAALAGNGMKAFSMHLYDASTAPLFAKLAEERKASPALSFAGAAGVASLDPETAASRYLRQALASNTVRGLTAPKPSGVESQFKSLGTETVPLTGTKTVKFRQTVGGIPVYGSLVTVELDDANSMVSLNSSLGTPLGVDPVAKIAPGRRHHRRRQVSRLRQDARRCRPAPLLLLRPDEIQVAAGLHPRECAGQAPQAIVRFLPAEANELFRRREERRGRCRNTGDPDHVARGRIAPRTAKASPGRSASRSTAPRSCCGTPRSTSARSTSSSRIPKSRPVHSPARPSATRRPGRPALSAPRQRVGRGRFLAHRGQAQQHR